jgi:DNA-binding MarR family transcriptional regulator
MSRARAIRAYLRARRHRERIIGRELFADPAWDMLLDLYASALEERPVSISSLCLASAVPATTALRQIDSLLAAGLVRRRPDPADRRRRFIRLDELGWRRLNDYFATVDVAVLPGRVQGPDPFEVIW